MSAETHDWKDDPRLLAYALGERDELGASDLAEIEAALESDAACRAAYDELTGLLPRLERAFAGEGAAAGAASLGSAAHDEIREAASRPARARTMPAWARPLMAAGLLGLAGVATWAAIERPGSEASGPAVGEDRALAEAEEESAGSIEASEETAWRPEAEVPHDGLMLRSKARSAPGAPAPSRGYRGPADEIREPAPLGQALSEVAAADPRANWDAGDPLRADFEFDGDAEELEPAEEALDDVDALRPAKPFKSAADDPFSTFSIDVDTASYGMARAALNAGRLPDPDAVRVEEFVNYFDYADPGPAIGAPEPFAVHVEVAAAPWEPAHRLVRIGVQAQEVDLSRRESANIVFLVDVSGSMNRANKLPLVKSALKTLTESLRPDDRIAIVVYAGSEGLALESTPMAAREAILQALERLDAGGSTNAGAGIQLAYDVARQNFVTGGINRVVLCTDGDFNVGVTGEGALEELIAGEAATGIELTVLGFGRSSGGDSRMEALSNRGDGNYAVIDSEMSARRVLAEELGGTLVTVAKDVKIQVAFNERQVQAYRLVGYENRMLAHADFTDDRVDAGEIGSGHHVTALYEVVPVGVPFDAAREDVEAALADAGEPGDADDAFEGGVGASEGDDGAGRAAPPEPYRGEGLMEVRLRFKRPGRATSEPFRREASDGGQPFATASDDLRFAASVAAFARILRRSAAAEGVTLADVRRWALEAKGEDPGGLREAFIGLVERAIELEAR